MSFDHPNAIARYARDTRRQIVFNAARKRCEGCAAIRSIGQFGSLSDRFCSQCVRRGITVPKSTQRRPQPENQS